MTINYEDRIGWALEVSEELKDYWPLTLRQIFYQLVSRLYIPNEHNQYKALSSALSKGRKEGRIPWEMIEDRTRPLYGGLGWGDYRRYITYHVQPLAENYARNLMEGQDYYIELFVEKQALITPFERAAEPYRLLVNMGRGYSSTTALKEMADRFSRRMRAGYQPLVLAFSDFDPSGVDLVDNLSRQFRDFGILPEVERIALTRDQIVHYDLPHDPKALKRTDARAAGFIEEYGEYAVELDALSPAVLEMLVGDSIGYRLDMEEYERQANIEEHERQILTERVNRWLQEDM